MAGTRSEHSGCWGGSLMSAPHAPSTACFTLHPHGHNPSRREKGSRAVCLGTAQRLRVESARLLAHQVISPGTPCVYQLATLLPPCS